MDIEKAKINTNEPKRILVAEDNESNFLLVVAILKKEYTIIRAHDGQEAIDQYEQVIPDAILMDIKMPGMDGLTATRKIREFNPQIPIIALSAFAFETDKQEAIKAGCSAYITKPLDCKILKSTLKQYLFLESEK